MLGDWKAWATVEMMARITRAWTRNRNGKRRICLHMVYGAASVWRERFFGDREGGPKAALLLPDCDTYWMVRVMLLEAPEPGFWEVSVIDCAVARSAAAIATWRCALSV